MELEFEEISFDENGCITNYPAQEGEQFVVITSDDILIHCISVYSWEDTVSGPIPLLICVPFDDSYDKVIEFDSCKMVAYFDN